MVCTPVTRVLLDALWLDYCGRIIPKYSRGAGTALGATPVSDLQAGVE
jgi:hypothetical protein